MTDIIDLEKARRLAELEAQATRLEEELASLNAVMERARIRCVCGEGVFRVHQTKQSLRLTCESCGVEGHSTKPVFRKDDDE